MRKILKLILVIVLVGLVLYFGLTRQSKQNSHVSSVLVSPAVSPEIKKASNSQQHSWLFVPYWSSMEGLNSDSRYDRLIYFGLSVNENAVVKDDSGYKGLDLFLNSSGGARKFLAIRMTDSGFDSKALDSADLQKKIIADSVSLAKQKGFDGVVLDFEISAIAFEGVVKDISNFESNFAKEAHGRGLQFYPTVYGDVFYRLRPYDISLIAKKSDGILVMAYDFHKAGGDPGSNFPLNGDDYDFKRMTADFLDKISADKITMVFGMFGYDWKVDTKGQSIEVASPITDMEAKSKFLNGCSLDSCQIKRDQNSAETEVTYKDASGQKHVVWFEDQTSVTKKIDFLKSKDIYSVGYWAWGYF